MGALAIDSQATIVRPIIEADTRDILRMVDTAWRVHIRIASADLRAKIKSVPGFLAEDSAGLRGFMLIEPQHPNTALIIAAGLRDTWGVRPYLDLLLPEIEQAAQVRDLLALVHIGHEAWLVNGLRERGFETREWIVNYERFGAEPPPTVSMPALIRTAHRKDLRAIMALDRLAFDYLWRKSAGNFSEALANAASFALADVDGQIVGYEWCQVYRQRAHLTRLAVHPDYQGRGIGAQLLHRAITDVQTAGVSLITLNTQESNHRSRALYKRFGFVKTRQRMPVLFLDLK